MIVTGEPVVLPGIDLVDNLSPCDGLESIPRSRPQLVHPQESHGQPKET